MTSQHYVIKISLLYMKPPVWRRLIIDPTITFEDLHYIIQTVMPWTNSHLHQFVVAERTRDMQLIVSPDELEENWGAEGIDSTTITVDSVLKQPNDMVKYEYDFGDDWQHHITLEKIVDPDPQKVPPFCLRVAKACPPDDTGGAWGFMRLLKVLQDPEHPDYEKYSEYFPNVEELLIAPTVAELNAQLEPLRKKKRKRKAK